MARNRVIYQSEALFVSPNSTGYHFSGEGSTGISMATGILGIGGTHVRDSGNMVSQLSRVQSANYSFTINRTDINEFGRLARIDALITESPTVSLDFTYYPIDGKNEALLKFETDGTTNCIKNHLNDTVGSNFFIQTTAEGTDVAGNTEADSTKTTIGLGNGFLSDYTFDASVGSIPTASVTIEGFNMKADQGVTGNSIPAVTLEDGSPIDEIQYSLPSGSTGDHGIAALRPGDLKLLFPSDSALITNTSGEGGGTAAHVQSVSFNIPMSRTPIERLGSVFPYVRVPDVPLNASFTINALVADIGTGNLAVLIDNEEKQELTVEMTNPADNNKTMSFTIKGALLDSESFSSDIGGNKTVDMTFTTQVGGPEDTENGVFISGMYDTDYLPDYSVVSGEAT